MLIFRPSQQQISSVPPGRSNAENTHVQAAQYLHSNTDQHSLNAPMMLLPTPPMPQLPTPPVPQLSVAKSSPNQRAINNTRSNQQDITSRFKLKENDKENKDDFEKKTPRTPSIRSQSAGRGGRKLSNYPLVATAVLHLFVHHS